MISDWTILNKKHASVCHSIAQVAQLDMLIFFSLYVCTRPDSVISRPAIMVNGTEYFEKIMAYLGQCQASHAWQDWLPKIQMNHATDAYCYQYSIDLQYDLLFLARYNTYFNAT